MDFEWTNRPDTRPVWSSKDNDTSTPRKRPIGEYLSPAAYPWSPPPNFSAAKAFQHEEPKDIDMSETSPAKTLVEQNENENERPMALGALRRVYNRRQKSRISKSRLRQRSNSEDEGPDLSEDDDEIAPLTQNTSNHYTLNMPAPAASSSEAPYVLLGYLQFFFNLSLILLFLYLVVQFIVTIQRDVQQRVTEYSQEIVQEIAMCVLQYKNNLCEANPVPAMVQQCAKWEACMNRDPAVIGRAKLENTGFCTQFSGVLNGLCQCSLIIVSFTASAPYVSSEPPLSHDPCGIFSAIPFSPEQLADHATR
ncbi:hypothetical protein Agabi119p4_1261 [Agaricus bisporus var. burnettii]|uniref:Brl1/Brr6 domain-containing protein n=1 Tax=Agaricus bisporus var. burnettii TaxID=192524 RepID=A0A8H7KLZ2_AGABI|nr:hypothetical protein Agabi119p4_1261 [Agaricus bisporus var. burnettii]